MSEAVQVFETRDISRCRESLFEKNRRNLLLSLLGCVFKTLSVLGFSTFTQKILDTVSGEGKYSELLEKCEPLQRLVNKAKT